MTTVDCIDLVTGESPDNRIFQLFLEFQLLGNINPFGWFVKKS